MPSFSKKWVLSVRVREASAADIPGIMILERQSSSSPHWSGRQYEEVFRESRGWNSRRYAWVAEDDSEPRADDRAGARPAPLGFLVARQVEAEWELENIVVAYSARRRGVGTALLGSLITIAQEKRAQTILLEVRQSNEGARALYGKLGFRETGIRKGYYSNPSEDAVLCRFRFEADS